MLLQSQHWPSRSISASEFMKEDAKAGLTTCRVRCLTMISAPRVHELDRFNLSQYAFCHSSAASQSSLHWSALESWPLRRWKYINRNWNEWLIYHLLHDHLQRHTPQTQGQQTLASHQSKVQFQIFLNLNSVSQRFACYRRCSWARKWE